MVASTAARNLNCIKKICFANENVPCACVFDEISSAWDIIPSFVRSDACPRLMIQEQFHITVLSGFGSLIAKAGK